MSNQDHHSPVSAAAPSMTAALCWGAMFPIAAAAMGHVDAFNLTAIRYGVATLLFLALLAAVEGRGALRFDGRFGRALLFGSLGFAGFNLLSYEGLRHTTPQHASLIAALMPSITVLMRWRLTGERPDGTLLTWIAVAFLGVALVIVGDDPSAALKGGVGDLLILVGAACWARYTLSGPTEFSGWSPLRLTALSAAAGTLTIMSIAVIGDLAGVFDVPALGDVRAARWDIAYIIVFGALVAVLAWNAGVQRIGPSNAALFMNLVPVTTFTIQAARGATPAPVELVGAAITLAALVAANVSTRGPKLSAVGLRRAGVAVPSD